MENESRDINKNALQCSQEFAYKARLKIKPQRLLSSILTVGNMLLLCLEFYKSDLGRPPRCITKIDDYSVSLIYHQSVSRVFICDLQVSFDTSKTVQGFRCDGTVKQRKLCKERRPCNKILPSTSSINFAISSKIKTLDVGVGSAILARAKRDVTSSFERLQATEEFTID